MFYIVCPDAAEFLGCVNATHIFVSFSGPNMAAFPVMVPDFYIL